MTGQKCKNCTYYTAYYKQWANGYGRLSSGYCARQNSPKTQFESCEDFKSNETKEKRRDEKRLEYLEQALKSIVEIAQILKEKESERT